MKQVVFLLSVAVALYGAAPSLQELHPRGAQRGKTFTLILRGESLAQGAEVKTTLPASFSRLTLSKNPLAEFSGSMRAGSILPFLVTLKAEAAVGLYPIRVITKEGISNVLLFSVGDLPEVGELEASNPKQLNDFSAEAQKVPIPSVINGTLAGADVDTYSFSVQAGQKLVFEVEARRTGSAIDPAIEIIDAAGRPLAKNDDAPGLGVDSRLTVTFAKAGEYRVQIHDSKYSDQVQNFYRLKIGSYDYAEGLFPLGWKRGESVEVSLLGGNLVQPVKVKPDLQTKSAFVPVRMPSSSSLPLLFAVSDQPEVLEPESGSKNEPACAPDRNPAVKSGCAPELPAHTVMNGRISKPGEVDVYRLPVKPGQKWVFELTAASLGTSRLDAVLTVSDATGKKLGSGDDGSGLDPVLPFTVPADVKEIFIAVEDLLGRGGPTFGYRLVAKQQPPDFTADLLTPFVNVPSGGTAQAVVTIQRRGYDGAIRLKVPDLPDGFTVAGGNVPSEAAAQIFNNDNAGRRTARSVLTITAPAESKPQTFDLTVMAEADTPEGKIQRYARPPGMLTAVRGDKQKPFTAPWLEMPLPVAITDPSPVTLEISTPLVRFAQGFEYDLEYRVKRSSGAKMPVKVVQQIAGAVGNVRILKGLEAKNPDAGSFMVNTNFSTPFTTFDMILEAQTEIDGKPVSIPSRAISIQVVPGYEIQLADTAVQVAPGGKVQVAGKVRREPTFEGGAIRVQVEDLPENVKCPAVEVPAERNEFQLACEATSAAKPGSFEIRVASTAPNTGRKAKQDYKIADVNAKLIVGGTTQASK